MVLLILESLGSTELLFILAMALVFFGPRKLPQISRSLGKSLADFRRASEDFKRTWDREASLEDTSRIGSPAVVENSAVASTGVQAPSIAAIAPDQVIARQSMPNSLHAPDNGEASAAVIDVPNSTDEPRHAAKNDWL